MVKWSNGQMVFKWSNGVQRSQGGQTVKRSNGQKESSASKIGGQSAGSHQRLRFDGERVTFGHGRSRSVTVGHGRSRSTERRALPPVEASRIGPPKRAMLFCIVPFKTSHAVPHCAGASISSCASLCFVLHRAPYSAGAASRSLRPSAGRCACAAALQRRVTAGDGDPWPSCAAFSYIL